MGVGRQRLRARNLRWPGKDLDPPSGNRVSPIGAALGVLVRKGTAYPPKLAGIGIVVAGLILAAFS